MAITQLQVEALSQLCSNDQVDLLNLIDQLRSEGINHYVSLPQIIVRGDQSARKSSVLEAISHVSFPVSSSVSIVPHASRTEAERLLFSEFHKELEDLAGLGKMIEAAKDAMGIHARGKTFSKNSLRIEITGPETPQLTIVDLPGLIHSATRGQTEDDVKLIKDVVKDYIISAKNDLANQIVLKMAKEADPTGQGTMGVITKPDILFSGSENEFHFASLAQNKEIEFRLGWHVLKNLDSEKVSSSLTKRDFEEDVDVLTRQIASELPSLVEEIALQLRVRREELERMGQRRATKDERNSYLVKISMMFQSLIKASIDGVYNDRFFEDAESDRGYCQRLRAVIQNSNQQFARDLSARGHNRQIVPLLAEDDQEEDLEGKVQVTRDKFIETSPSVPL
ncbi:hypothetical protein diail_12154 [Diaporthe ilicicola]|nr:hypothetical protein diail_12154 [Diaporthe ilicicola]